MSFPEEVSIIPQSRGGIEIQFYIPDPDLAEDVQFGQIGVQIKYSDGSIKEHRFDLLDHLTDDSEGQIHLSNLVSLRDYLINRINTEVLGQ